MYALCLDREIFKKNNLTSKESFYFLCPDSESPILICNYKEYRGKKVSRKGINVFRDCRIDYFDRLLIRHPKEGEKFSEVIFIPIKNSLYNQIRSTELQDSKLSEIVNQLNEERVR